MLPLLLHLQDVTGIMQVIWSRMLLFGHKVEAQCSISAAGPSSIFFHRHLHDSHWTKPWLTVTCFVFWYRSHFLVISSAFLACLFEPLLFLFSNRSSYALWGILFWLGLACFSMSGDSTVSTVFCVRIGFEPCNNLYLAVFVLLDHTTCICFVARCVSFHGYKFLIPSSFVTS